MDFVIPQGCNSRQMVVSILLGGKDPREVPDSDLLALSQKIRSKEVNVEHFFDHPKAKAGAASGIQDFISNILRNRERRQGNSGTYSNNWYH